MPRNRNPGHDPDDRKENDRSQTAVGRRGDEHEDIEESRAKQRRPDASDETDDETLAEEDIVEVDLDAAPEGEGPDA